VIVITCVVMLFAIWLRRPLLIAEYYAQTGWAVFVTGAIVSICFLGLGAPPRRPWRWIGVVCALGALALWLGGIWIGRGSDVGFATFTGLLTGSALVAYAMMCVAFPVKERQIRFRNGLIGVAGATAVFIELGVMADRGLISGDVSFIERCMAAGAIVTGCGTLALVVLARLNRRIDVAAGGEALTDIVVICPRCRKKQSLAIGDAACAACGLRISTRVEEPRCPTCDYLLIGLTSDRCPECGTAIAPNH
jgi:hypothetical protein